MPLTPCPKAIDADRPPPQDWERHVQPEAALSSTTLGWPPAGRVCPVLTKDGAIGLTDRQAERPKTPVTSLLQDTPMEGSATEDLLPGNPQQVMHQ